MVQPSSLSAVSAVAWDLIVIGGGITGAAVLREAARVGRRVLLIEQRDFAWGTSSRSGKWVHGGLRYMQQGQAHVTWQSVRARERLAAEAPGLVDMRPMYMPFRRREGRRRAMMRIAVLIYDLMAGRSRRRLAPATEFIARFPGFDGGDLADALVFYEAQTDDARLTLRVLQEAIADGAVALNYVRAETLSFADGRVAGVVVRDADGGEPVELRAKQVIAATGAWADKLRRQVRKANDEHLRPLRGSHLVLSAERVPIPETVVVPHPKDRRLCFIAPWQGRVLIGNTEIDHDRDMDEEAAATSAEVDYLLAPLIARFPRLGIGRGDVIASFSGVRPVVGAGKADPSRESREHVLWHEDGLLTIAGGKLTTFRAIALDALKAVADRLGPPPRPTSDGRVFPPAHLPERLPEGLSRTAALRLLGRYGTAATAAMIAAAAPADLAPIPGTDTLWAELPWCAGNERVRRLEDLMLRRTRIGLLLAEGGAEHLPRIRDLVQARLGWSDATWEAEVAAYGALWRSHYSVPPATGGDGA